MLNVGIGYTYRVRRSLIVWMVSMMLPGERVLQRPDKWTSQPTPAVPFPNRRSLDNVIPRGLPGWIRQFGLSPIRDVGLSKEEPGTLGEVRLVRLEELRAEPFPPGFQRLLACWMDNFRLWPFQAAWSAPSPQPSGFQPQVARAWAGVQPHICTDLAARLGILPVQIFDAAEKS